MRIGIVQGRLSRQTQAGYQAFPWDSWETEFELARLRNLRHIEWVVDLPFAKSDMANRVKKNVQRLSSDTQVEIKSACLDYVMQLGNFDLSETLSLSSRIIPEILDFGVKQIVIPFVDDTSIHHGRLTRSKAMKLIEGILSMSDDQELEICIESDLRPVDLLAFVNSLDRTRVSINYDIGNSASMGYYWREEIDAYFDRISLVHIKDRKLNGPSVPLGSGKASIQSILDEFRSREYRGTWTLQTFRDWEGLNALDSQISWLRGKCGVVFD